MKKIAIFFLAGFLAIGTTGCFTKIQVIDDGSGTNKVENV
jgi:hypothetical protein